MASQDCLWLPFSLNFNIVLIVLLAVVIVLIILSIFGYIFNWGWTGLGPYISPPYAKDSAFQRGKTLWDWLQLLIIPAVLAVAGYVINLTISRGEQEATKHRAQSEREAAEKRAETEREIALDSQREAAFKEYIDKMSELILHEDLLGSDPKKEVREIARIQTLTVLNRLDGKRKGRVLQFLNDAKLINKYKTVIDLKGANMIEADLCQAHLNGARLYGVDLSRADLCQAYLGQIPFCVDFDEEEFKEAIEEGVLILDESDLRFANLSGANLSEAYLAATDLRHSNLSGANLSGAYLYAVNLSHADLTKADLSHAELESSNLTSANLTKADLTNTVLDENSIKYKGCGNWPDIDGVTMPDGSIHQES